MQLALASGAGPLTHLASTSTAATTSTTTRPNKTTARSVPAFLNKLFTMVSDPSTDDLIRWSEDGDSFLVPSADKFGKELLPRFFKHSNFGSFVRQLNMYGFHKVPHLTQGVLKSDGGESPELLEFTNPNFARAQPDLLFFIRRQKAKGDSNNPASASSASNRHNHHTSLAGPSGTSASAATSTSSALDLPSLLTDLSAIRKHQTAISADLKDLQQSNQLLWQEALASREKHRKQEDTINKILRFLAGVFGGQVLDTSGTNATASANAAASPGADSNAESVGSEAGEAGQGGNRKGKGKAKANDRGVVAFPKGRSRLLLEDVKGRQQERAAALRELDGSDDDDEHEDDDEEDIEEIPVLQRDDDRFPTISSSSHAASLPAQQPPPPTALTRTNSGSNAMTSPNRFTSLPPASPSTTNAFSNLDFSSFSPDTMQQFLAAAGGGGANDPNSLAALFNNKGGSGSALGSNPNSGPTLSSHSLGGGSSTALSLAPSSSTCFDFGVGAMVPTSSSAFHPTTTSNPLEFGHIPTSAALAPTSFPTFPSPAPALSPSLVSNINDHDEILRSVINEKQDIDRRTTELEDQISRLLKNLPEETRDQVLDTDGPLGTASGLGTAVEEKGGFDWGTATGENGELDLDKLLEQFTNAPTPHASHSTPGQSGDVDPSLSTPMDYSAFFPDPLTADSTTPVNNPLYQSTTGSLPFPSDADTNPIAFPYEATSPASEASANESAYGVRSPGKADKNSAGGGGGGGGGARKRKSDVLSPLGEGAPSPAREGTRRSSRRKT